MIFEYRPGLAGSRFGLIEAVTQTVARKRLVDRGVQVMKLRKVNPHSLDLFWQIMELIKDLMSQGLPLSRSLELIERSDDIKLSRAAAVIRFYLLAGRTVSESFSLGFANLPRHITEMLSLGDETACLPRVVAELSDAHIRRLENNAKLREALAYPIFVVVSSVIVFWVLFDIILPGFSSLMMGVEPGLASSLVFSLTGKVGDFIEIAVWVSVITLGAQVVASRFQGTRRLTNELALAVPGLRNLLLSIERLRFLEVWSLALSAGISAERGLVFAEKSIANEILRERVGQSRNLIRAGYSIDEALKSSEILNSQDLFRLQMGSEVGGVEQTLRHLSLAARRDSLHRLGVIIGILGPITIVMLGLVIGAVTVGVVVPIFSIQDTIDIGDI